MINNSPLVIGLAGFGTVGSGLAEVLRENAALIRNRIGRELKIKTVLVRDANKPRDFALPEGASLTANPQELVNDQEIDVLVELMGGMDTAGNLIRSALSAGKHVVTANKALLAEQGGELFKLAAEKRLTLAFEASVCGAIPILQVLRESLAELDARSRDIIKRRWLDADSKVTLQELADEYGVSAERIRQIEANALKKMKALFAA